MRIAKIAFGFRPQMTEENCRARRVMVFGIWLALMTITSATFGQDTHPHILAKPADKELILQKMAKQAWAKKSYDEMEKTVSVYVARHQKDPEWILSRYLMNRVPGKRYTKFISDEDGTALTGYGGDAPVPTVRVSPHKRPPVTADGYSYRLPSIDELLPYDTSMKMSLVSNAPGGKKEFVNPQTFVENINGRINELALHASIIYWLTGKEEYAKFGADILNQWAQGAFYQLPIEGPCRTGFLSIQTLGDGHYEPMPLIYDFLYHYIRQKGYQTSFYETVFDKIANTMTFRGFWNNNWFAAQAPAMIFAALSLENKQRRDYYINFYINRDTINGGCGHLALPSVISKWLTPDGHWKEPGGYHNFPVSSLLISALALENNGHNLFGKFPALLQSSYVLLKYSFPNFIAPSIGDTGPVSQSPECLEIGILMAKKYGNSMLSQLLAAMDVMIEKKGYRREASGWLGLLSFLPEIPASTTAYIWPRSGELDFARCYIQRNGSSKDHGLMYLVQGATYNHNHANGMSLELYGAGSVMGVDPGKGITYEAPMHVNYYAQWAAHNTVVAGGLSSSVPYFKGGGGTKHIGQVELAAMEPLAGKEAISRYCSFTDTRYTDISTGTLQQRTVAIIRTSDSTGYYIDIYRSAHPKSNEYVYHNIGNDIKLLNEQRKQVATSAAKFPLSTEPYDPPGFRLIQDFRTAGKTADEITALFPLTEGGDNRYMQVLFAGETQREFYSGMGPRSGTADIPYRNLPTPTLVCRQEGEAWKRPFIAIYEPYHGANGFSIQSVENADRSNPGEFSAIRVHGRNAKTHLIFQSLNDRLHQGNGFSFNASFAVISLENNRTSFIYLGEGKSISSNGYIVASEEGRASAHLEIQEFRPSTDGGRLATDQKLKVSCDKPVRITIPNMRATRVSLSQDGNLKSLEAVKIKNAISFTIPAVTEANILIQ